jgi:hypothetical protein
MTPPVREILSPTDFSDLGRQAGLTAAGFAQHFDPRLHVVRVVAPVRDPSQRRGHHAGHA